MKVLLVENIHPVAESFFISKGFEVTRLAHALSENELISELPKYHMLGIRSKTEVTEGVLKKNPHLVSVACFCIGTNQIALGRAKKLGIPVFNAPHSNTRSVAELVIAEMIALARHLFDRSSEVHRGYWNKTAKNSFEIRGKTLGIVGYGHIGSQVSVLAEAMGMKVIFYDIVKKLPLGNAQSCESLAELLKESDFVTLHVPATPQTKNMMDAYHLGLMKKGAYLLNLSRGNVVDLEALSERIKAGHIAGAAIDVYPSEPKANGEGFVSVLQGLPNVILTPHVGGSTEEAQERIGEEVSRTLWQYAKWGTTLGAVNFPKADLPVMHYEGAKYPVYRVMNIHRNEPGAMGALNQTLAAMKGNILGQSLMTDMDLGYVILDVEAPSPFSSEAINFPASLRTRVLPLGA
ncbi:MAG: phosphoglycerate dehydrogenase [Bdellovibrionaceae bacterium]|jgi:D-3-phosphoglycerate dehydrogenase|nr:phosphoglycerate dehydrogenase [Pseudobdellovibrionaceae bacterium]